MKRLYGNTAGLKANQIRRLEALYRRRIPIQQLISLPLLREMGRLSREVRRQIGLLIDRAGRVNHVIVGDRQKIVIPDLSGYRLASGRLKGLRCVHTHLAEEALTEDDLTDLCFLALDFMAAVTVSEEGDPLRVYAAHILPRGLRDKLYDLLPPLRPDQMDMDCLDRIQALETELSLFEGVQKTIIYTERAILMHAGNMPKHREQESRRELLALARSCGLDVVGVEAYRRTTGGPLPLGKGKVQQLSISALQKGATMVVFDQELNPSQIRSIADHLQLKIIDRTQLILDIFAQRARTREGKLQVELAQLKYLLPRLVTKNTAMSRLTGGIGGRGPGETKLEINRRRARDRIGRLETALLQVRKNRKIQRGMRGKKRLPVVSIVGYTNAGKSTLLNTLTHSQVLAESRLFATLDPSSRRLRFPRDMEVIITDTVGFIRDLPQDLRVAFRATLEELEQADLLLHVIDISHPHFPEQMESVEKILEELELGETPVLRVLNKMDLVEASEANVWRRKYDGICVSARDRSTLAGLIETMEYILSIPR
ncbi:MAG: GTPase HflX [Deltaproteobacteria bacterium]|nr:GTPase HflX [Deltaproteobacteria bacterium]